MSLVCNCLSQHNGAKGQFAWSHESKLQSQEKKSRRKQLQPSRNGHEKSLTTHIRVFKSEGVGLVDTWLNFSYWMFQRFGCSPCVHALLFLLLSDPGSTDSFIWGKRETSDHRLVYHRDGWEGKARCPALCQLVGSDSNNLEEAAAHPSTFTSSGGSALRLQRWYKLGFY